MPEELKVALVSFVQRLIDLVNSGADQLPAITKDIIGAALLNATVWWWFGVAIIVIGVIVILLDCYVFEDGFASIVGVLMGILGGAFIAYNQYAYMYTTRFPRLVILDYLKGLL